MSWKPWTIRILYVGHEINQNNGINWYLKKTIEKSNNNDNNYIPLTFEMIY